MKKTTVVATNELFESLFRQGNTINARVINGLPRDAKLIDVQIDRQHDEVVFSFHTADDSVDGQADIKWGKDNRIDCIKHELERQALKELMVPPQALIQEISNIVNDKCPVEAKV